MQAYALAAVSLERSHPVGSDVFHDEPMPLLALILALGLAMDLILVYSSIGRELMMCCANASEPT